MDIHAYLKDFANKDCLKFVVAGSVDDGKSTLIGRLLFECKGIHADQLASLEKASKKRGSDLDFALLTDGLKSEREQGITIDVAYRYFSSPKRRFVIIDVPGHEQYTRNMATGASQADFGLLLIDAKLGLTEQTRRHSFILSLMGVSHVLIVVNKMDLVNFKKERFKEIKEDYKEFSSRLNFQNITFIPVSALHGDNIAEVSKNIPWYNDGTVLSYLEKVTIQKVENLVDFRLPVQTTLIGGGVRRYAGTISSGIVRTGDEVEILPSGIKANIKDIIYMGEHVNEAFPPMAIQVGLNKELDVSRGNMIVHPNNHTYTDQEIEALIVWMDDDASLKKGYSYTIKHTTLSCTGIVTNIDYGIDVNTLRQEDRDTLELNEIGRVRISLSQPLCFETYKTNRITGSFIIIDRFTHKTVALGTIINRRKHKERPNRNLKHFDGNKISLKDRLDILNSNPYTIWFTGLSGSGKSTLAYSLEKYLINRGQNAFVLDGDTVRDKLNGDLGFSVVDREENIRRVSEIAKLFNDAGVFCLCAFVSPYEQYRIMAKNIIGKFIEVYVKTPIETCRERREILFSKAEKGNILNFPGVNDRFDEPSNPDLILCGTDNQEDNLRKLMELLKRIN